MHVVDPPNWLWLKLWTVSAQHTSNAMSTSTSFQQVHKENIATSNLTKVQMQVCGRKQIKRLNV